MKLKTGRHTSALKEARKNQKRQIVNRAVKSRIKTAVKKYEAALSEKNIEKAEISMREISSILDKSAKKNIVRRKTASRKISRLMSKLAKIKK